MVGLVANSLNRCLPDAGRHRTRNGFTLVELLVVMAIIALMIAALMPALSKAREAAHLVKCQSNLRQQGIAMLTYAGDFKGFLPALNVYKDPPLHDDYGPDKFRSTWMIKLSGYLGGPSPAAMNNRAGFANSSDAMMDVFQCPTTWDIGDYDREGHSYGVNTFIVSPHRWSDIAYGPTPLKYFDQRGRADRMIMIGDCYVYTPVRGVNWKTTLGHAIPEVNKNHDMGLNFVFVDGHASYTGTIDPTLMDAEDPSSARDVDMVMGTGASWDYLGMSW